jgi:hypothetical protein
MSGRRDHEEMVVVTKTYDLILWSCHHTGKFPRKHRFVLGERIERNLYDLLETLIGAEYTRQRQGLLEHANPTLAMLRFQMRLAKDLRCLRVNSLRHYFHGRGGLGWHGGQVRHAGKAAGEARAQIDD